MSRKQDYAEAVWNTLVGLGPLTLEGLMVETGLNYTQVRQGLHYARNTIALDQNVALVENVGYYQLTSDMGDSLEYMNRQLRYTLTRTITSGCQILATVHGRTRQAQVLRAAAKASVASAQSQIATLTMTDPTVVLDLDVLAPEFAAAVARLP